MSFSVSAVIVKTSSGCGYFSSSFNSCVIYSEGMLKWTSDTVHFHGIVFT